MESFVADSVGIYLCNRSFFYFVDIYSVGIVADSNSYDQSKRLRTGGDYSHSAYTTPPPFHPPPAPVWGPHG